MNQLEIKSYRFSLDQWSPTPSWVQFEIHEGERSFRVSMYPEDFKVFVAWLEAGARYIVKLGEEK